MKRFFNFVATLVVGAAAFSVLSCEDDISGVGSGLLDTGSTANAYYVDLIAYNTNNDSIRSDENVLQNGVVGVYEDPIFGRTKAKFYSQARLSNLNPNFGTNPAVDSVILNIPVHTKAGDDNIQVDTTYVYLQPGQEPSDTSTIIIKRTYKLDSIYGKTDLPMTLKVREVAQYLHNQDSIYYSNPNLNACGACVSNNIQVYPQVLGSKVITNKVSTFSRQKKNEVKTAPTPYLRVKLDSAYFKSKFVDNQNSPDLQDQSSFIRNFFRGIELSVDETQGFLMNFNPNMSLSIHYSYDDTTTEEEGDRKTGTLGLTFSSIWNTTGGYNVQINQFEHANRSSEFVNAYTQPDLVNGAARLYLAGMDGTKTIIKLNQDQLNEIRNNVLSNDWAIVGAELILHVDESYGFTKPPYLMAWNFYKDGNKYLSKNFVDIMSFYNSYPVSVQFNPKYDYTNNPNKYVIRITDYIKSMVEGNEVFEDGQIILSLGNFLLSPSTGYTGVYNATDPYMNDRAFNPHRIVLHGNASEQVDKRLRLKVYYTKK